MKVAAVATMCQDRRVFDAMLAAGTPCPYEGKIGEQAKASWAKFVGAANLLQALASQAVAGMRVATRNQLEIACTMYANPENRSRQRALRTVADPTAEWHAAQNKQLRSCPEALRWDMVQAAGGYVEHLRQTWSP